MKEKETVVMPCKHDIDNAIVYMENHHADAMYFRIKCMNTHNIAIIWKIDH